MALIITRLFFVLSFTAQSLCAQMVTIDNNLPKKDPAGAIIDVHDGNMIQTGGYFYWYGTAYGNTNGYTKDNIFQCYRSIDLVHWSGGGNLLLNAPAGIYYRPHIIYNAGTKQYVLWYNWYPKFWEGKFGVAVSKDPMGPFTIINDDVKVQHMDKGLGDLNLFADDDGTGYLVYNTIAGHFVSVEKLNPDYLSSTFENSGILAKDCEAETMFKRNGKYYVLTDQACCFCNYGTGARVFTSNHALGKFEEKNNINRYPGTLTPGLIDGFSNGNVFETLQKTGDHFAQAEIDLPLSQQLDSVIVHVFAGNRPQNCGDVNIPKVHPDFVNPLFDIWVWLDTSWIKIAPALIRVDTLAIQRIIRIALPKTKASKVKLVPHDNYAFNEIFLAEIVLKSGTNSIAGLTAGAKAYFISGNKPMPVIPAQQAHIIPLQTGNGIEYIWMGDLWGSAPDNSKAHDFQYWAPLEFDAAGNILPLQWIDSWNVQLK